MKVVPLVLSTISLGLLAAFGEPSTVIGSIDKITGSNITVKTARGLFFIHADERTETLKDKTYRGFSALKLGDEISIRCQPDVSDKLVAVKIWAKVITFSAIVKHVNSIISRPWPPALDEIEVVTIPNADDHREDHLIVRLYADTAFSTTRKDLTIGQRIHVVGLDVGNGAVDAARIALYNTDMPTK